MAYVKGYRVAWDKIKTLINAEHLNDRRIDIVVYKVLELVDRDVHRICMGTRINGSDIDDPNIRDDDPDTRVDKELLNVISFGEAAFGDDLEELRNKDIPIPEYLRKLEFVLHGPDVFEFHSCIFLKIIYFPSFFALNIGFIDGVSSNSTAFYPPLKPNKQTSHDMLAQLSARQEDGYGAVDGALTFLAHDCLVTNECCPCGGGGYVAIFPKCVKRP